MENSRDLLKLRPDIIPYVTAGFNKLRLRGWTPALSCTYRDQEYQTFLNKQGKAPALVSFHGARLAFDIFNDVPGNLYPAAFLRDAAEIFEAMGFTWGGRWKSYDGPHFQWDDHGEYTGVKVRSGQLPPNMPVYVEDDDMAKMTDEEFAEHMKRYMSVAGTGDMPSPWARESTEFLKAAGVMGGDGQGNYGWQKPITREAAAVLLHNLTKSGGLTNG